MVTVNYPDINLAIDGADSVNTICNKYIDMLNNSGNICFIEYANKLLEYLSIDEKIPLFEDEFHIFKKFLRTWSLNNNVSIFIKTRKKAFIEFNKKIRLLYPNIDKIHDLAGFKLVLKTKQFDTQESVALCYKLLNDIIIFFVVQRKCTVLEADNLYDTGDPHMPDIVIPKNNLIIEGFDTKVKDYIKNPKKNDGYQSLHFCVKSPSGLTFEIQVKTFAMDVRSDHQLYKTRKYSGCDINLDYSKISLPGIAFDKDNSLIFDNSGLLKSMDMFNNI